MNYFSLCPISILFSVTRMLLEQFPYSNIVCVSDEEPPTEHSLIIHLRSQASMQKHVLMIIAALTLGVKGGGGQKCN